MELLASIPELAFAFSKVYVLALRAYWQVPYQITLL
jgi:hypothetical protein